MKPLQEVQKEFQDAIVIPIDEFINMIRNGTLSSLDGIGMLYDGGHETDIEVDCNLTIWVV